jgi:predicted  nucleic acid-binding Zn-ribbon protein
MKKQPSSTTISFRIDSTLANELKKKGLSQRQSLHEYARNLFLDALAERDLRDQVIDLQSDVQDVDAAINDLRHDLSWVLYKFLTELTDLEPEEVQSWIATNLRS